MAFRPKILLKRCFGSHLCSRVDWKLTGSTTIIQHLWKLAPMHYPYLKPPDDSVVEHTVVEQHISQPPGPTACKCKMHLQNMCSKFILHKSVLPVLLCTQWPEGSLSSSWEFEPRENGCAFPYTSASQEHPLLHRRMLAKRIWAWMTDQILSVSQWGLNHAPSIKCNLWKDLWQGQSDHMYL